MDRGTQWATVHGVTESWTGLSDFNFHIDITSPWNLKNDMQELIYKQKQTHRCGEQFCGCQVRGCWEEKDWEVCG